MISLPHYRHMRNCGYNPLASACAAYRFSLGGVFAILLLLYMLGCIFDSAVEEHYTRHAQAVNQYMQVPPNVE